MLLVGSYLILRRDPYVDLRASMLFIVGLVAINLMAAVGLMSGTIANLSFIALFDKVSIVFQDVVLFNQSVMENTALCLTNADTVFLGYQGNV